MLHFERQFNTIPAGRSWHHLVFQYSPEDFPTFERFLMDFHANFPAGSMKELMRTFNALLTKLNHITSTYASLGYGREIPQMQDIFNSIFCMRDIVVLWRMSAASQLAILTGQKPPCIETAKETPNAVKLYNYVKSYAMSLGYRIGGPNDNVYVQNVCTFEGQEHKTPHWKHVLRRPQPGDLSQMSQDTPCRPPWISHQHLQMPHVVARSMH